MKIWGKYVEEVARVINILDGLTDSVNTDTGELEFMVPTRIDIEAFGTKAPFYLELEDGAWYLRDEEG